MSGQGKNFVLLAPLQHGVIRIKCINRWFRVYSTWIWTRKIGTNQFYSFLGKQIRKSAVKTVHVWNENGLSGMYEGIVDFVLEWNVVVMTSFSLYTVWWNCREKDCGSIQTRTIRIDINLQSHPQIRIRKFKY